MYNIVWFKLIYYCYCSYFCCNLVDGRIHFYPPEFHHLCHRNNPLHPHWDEICNKLRSEREKIKIIEYPFVLFDFFLFKFSLSTVSVLQWMCRGFFSSSFPCNFGFSFSVATLGALPSLPLLLLRVVSFAVMVIVAVAGLVAVRRDDDISRILCNRAICKVHVIICAFIY